ncbi:hypothetical protein [Flavicella marina]|uniref:hypothetical protein n=1 Tax=Flavicella marina TaxID=1475951 RepID=UPI0012651878|nr:hypothetical protein [Flavicella marina]
MSTNSQTNLEKIFCEIPIKTIDSFGYSARKKLIELHKINKGSIYKFEKSSKFYETLTELTQTKHNKGFQIRTSLGFADYYPKNGYLHLIESSYDSQSMNIVQICFWNKTNNEKLVVIKELHGMGFDYEDQVLTFYIYDNNEFKSIKNSDVLEEIQISDVLDLDRIKLDNVDILEFKKLFPDILQLDYELPIEGKDIIFSIMIEEYSHENAEKINNKLKTYLYDSFVYKYIDGKFIIERY